MNDEATQVVETPVVVATPPAEPDTAPPTDSQPEPEPESDPTPLSVPIHVTLAQEFVDQIKAAIDQAMADVRQTEQRIAAKAHQLLRYDGPSDVLHLPVKQGDVIPVLPHLADAIQRMQAAGHTFTPQE